MNNENSRMTTIESSEVLTEVVDDAPQDIITGQVKWFNDRLGYGFVTISDGDSRGKDIFVHHSGIKPANSNYKTLRKGEYVNFNIVKGLNGLQGVDITGINGGPLMCDIVMGSRKIAEPVPRDWQTVGKRPYQPKKPVKNVTKYNKNARQA